MRLEKVDARRRDRDERAGHPGRTHGELPRPISDGEGHRVIRVERIDRRMRDEHIWPNFAHHLDESLDIAGRDLERIVTQVERHEVAADGRSRASALTVAGAPYGLSGPPPPPPPGARPAPPPPPHSD